MSAPVVQCPRCGDWSLEVFRTHKYCACCNFSSLELETEKSPPTRAVRSTEYQHEEHKDEVPDVLVPA